MLIRTSLALMFTLAACSSNSSPASPDAATPSIDAAGSTATVLAVTCPATTPLTVTSVNGDNAKYTFAPTSNTVAVGSIVKFAMASSHNVAPYSAGPTDPGLKVDFGATKCLQFTKAGTFGFYCTLHTFHDSIVVQ